MNGLVLGLLCAAFLAHAQVSRHQPPQQPPAPAQPAATPVPPRPPRPGANCTAPEFRQFDFWLGAWAVAGPNGKEQGQSEITRAAEGCAVREQWTGTGGFNGLSINYYGRDGNWHQHWVGSDGLILHLSGSFDGKAMIMSGEGGTPQARTTERITWTPLADGRVSQQWESSADGGKTWKTSFVGYYSRR